MNLGAALRGLSVGRCNYVAIGDSVSAGEGIGYGYEWNDTIERWEDKDGSTDTWDDNERVADCHQTAYCPPSCPRLRSPGMHLRQHLSCTGATFDEGITGTGQGRIGPPRSADSTARRTPIRTTPTAIRIWSR